MQINSDAASFVFPVMMDHAGLLCVGILLAQPRIPVAGTYLPPRRVFESLGLCIFFFQPRSTPFLLSWPLHFCFFPTLVHHPLFSHGLSISAFPPPFVPPL